jgi:hypothetical protein
MGSATLALCPALRGLGAPNATHVPPHPPPAPEPKPPRGVPAAPGGGPYRAWRRVTSGVWRSILGAGQYGTAQVFENIMPHVRPRHSAHPSRDGPLWQNCPRGRAGRRAQQEPSGTQARHDPCAAWAGRPAAQRGASQTTRASAASKPGGACSRRRPRSGEGTLRGPVSLPWAPHVLAASGFIGINSVL